MELVHKNRLDNQLRALRETMASVMEEIEKLDAMQMMKAVAEIAETFTTATKRAQEISQVKLKEHSQQMAKEAIDQYIETNVEQVILHVLEKFVESGRIQAVSIHRSASERSEGGAFDALETGSNTMPKEFAPQMPLLSDKARDAVKHALSTREKSLQLLIDAGISDRDGGLNEGYRAQQQSDTSKGPR